MSRQMKPVSPSSLADFEGCARRFYHTRIIKSHVQKPTEAMSYGSETHRLLEEYVKTSAPLPKHLEKIGTDVIDKLRALGMTLFAEMKMAVTRDWTPTTWDAPDCWLRGIVDLVAINLETREACIFDYKTGRRKLDGTQLELYASVMLTVLKLKSVQAWYLWLKTDQSDDLKVTTENVEQIRARITKRIGAMELAHDIEDFPAKTSPLCAYCPVIFECEEALHYRKKARFLREASNNSR